MACEHEHRWLVADVQDARYERYEVLCAGCFTSSQPAPDDLSAQWQWTWERWHEDAGVSELVPE